MKRLQTGCGYQGYEFGSRDIPDSICCGGRLLEIDDCDGKISSDHGSEEIPCPVCREQDAVAYWADEFIVAGEEPASAMETALNFVAARRKPCAAEVGGCKSGDQGLSV